MKKITTQGKTIEQLYDILQKLEKINLTEKERESLQFLKDISYYTDTIQERLENFYFQNNIALTKEVQKKLENEILFIYRKILLQKFVDDNMIDDRSIDFFEKILLLTKENDKIFYDILE